jgi:hypothetical protein
VHLLHVAEEGVPLLHVAVSSLPMDHRGVPALHAVSQPAADPGVTQAAPNELDKQQRRDEEDNEETHIVSLNMEGRNSSPTHRVVVVSETENEYDVDDTYVSDDEWVDPLRNHPLARKPLFVVQGVV